MTSAVLFDVDGTLVDSNDAHTRAWLGALAAYGFDIPFDRVRPLIGMGGDRMLPQIDAGLSDETEPGRSILERRKELFLARELASVRPFPGARDLLAAVRERGARVIIATSATGSELDAILAVGDFAPLIDARTTSDDAESSKPAPDIIHAALAKGGVSAADAVMIGDTRWDIEAARNARVACVAVICGGSPAGELAGADAIYAGPVELIAGLDAAPFGLGARRAL